MSEQKKPETKPEDLTKTTEPGGINLTEEELGRVSGGAGGTQMEYLKVKLSGNLKISGGT